MSEAIIITPVKDSLETTKQTIDSICAAKGNFEYFVFNDFSNTETKEYLTEASKKYNFNLVNLEDITDTPSPNYKLVLQQSQKMALEKDVPLIIVESDVIVKEHTFIGLTRIEKEKSDAGLVGAITVGLDSNYNFPYTFEKTKNNDLLDTNHSLSFCCTLISRKFLSTFSFHELSENKDWFDVFISRQSIKLGFKNYLAKEFEVLHLPHSSRPWKNLKYKNPVLYYLKKIFLKRDRI